MYSTRFISVCPEKPLRLLLSHHYNEANKQELFNVFLFFFRYYLVIRVTRLKFKMYQVGFLYIIFTKQLVFLSKSSDPRRRKTPAVVSGIHSPLKTMDAASVPTASVFT